MTTDTELCTWSDLPRHTCQHCHTGDTTVGTVGQNGDRPR